ncbi:MAG: hypothetical protein J5896_03630 [Alphaproteobacteria bacterium]|nr:hypothetical protein [Alphaproteobacteria bacterium]
MIMTRKIKCCQAFNEKYPDLPANACYEAIAHGKSVEETGVHGFVINDLYFVDSKTMEIYSKDYFILVENIEDALQD